MTFCPDHMCAASRCAHIHEAAAEDYRRQCAAPTRKCPHCGQAFRLVWANDRYEFPAHDLGDESPGEECDSSGRPPKGNK